MFVERGAADRAHTMLRTSVAKPNMALAQHAKRHILSATLPVTALQEGRNDTHTTIRLCMSMRRW